MALITTSGAGQGVLLHSNPENDWVYDILRGMGGKGLLIGFQFGYGHVKHHSRDEVATAIEATYKRIESMFKRLQVQIDAIRYSSFKHEALRTQLNSLYMQVINLRKYVSDQGIRDLSRLTLVFEEDLTRVGADVKAMRMQLRQWLPNVSVGHGHERGHDALLSRGYREAAEH